MQNISLDDVADLAVNNSILLILIVHMYSLHGVNFYFVFSSNC